MEKAQVVVAPVFDPNTQEARGRSCYAALAGLELAMQNRLAASSFLFF